MKNLLILFIIAILLNFCQADQNVPIPDKPYGFTARQDSGYKLHLEFYVDLLCSDSQDQYFILKQALTSDLKIKLTYQPASLTWHYYAFKMHQAFFMILKNAGKQAAAKFIDYVMEKQQDYYEQEFRSIPMSQVLDNLAKQFAVQFKVNYQTLRSQLQFGTQSFNLARFNWKYATGMNGIGGAPIFYANGVRLDGASQWDKNQWRQFVKKYQ